MKNNNNDVYSYADFVWIMDTYGESTKRLIYTYVHNWSTAEDLTQEVFIRVYKHLPKLNKDSYIKTWIYRISVNICKDYFRKRKNRKEEITSYFNNNIALFDTPDNPEKELIEKEKNHILLQAIFLLPDKYKDIIILFYYQELQIKEISDVLQTNQSTIKTRLSRAKDRLKRTVGGVDFE